MYVFYNPVLMGGVSFYRSCKNASFQMGMFSLSFFPSVFIIAAGLSLSGVFTPPGLPNKTAIFFCNQQEWIRGTNPGALNREMVNFTLTSSISSWVAFRFQMLKRKLFWVPIKQNSIAVHRTKKKMLVPFCMLFNRLNNEASRIKETSDRE